MPRTDATRKKEREWYARNRDKVNARKRAWRKANKQKVQLYAKRQRERDLKDPVKVKAKKEYQKRWRENNKDRAWLLERRWRYRTTTEQLLQLRKEAKGRCAICRQKTDKLYVDHDHKTGRLRKLLCILCNSALGFFRDNPKYMEAGAAYVKSFR